MFITELLGNVKLGWLIKIEYVLMAFFIVGAITSQVGKPLKVKSKNFATISIVLSVFFFRGITATQALSQGHDGKVLSDILNNECFRCAFYAFLVVLLLRRLIKTCRAERIRKQRLFNLKQERAIQ